MAFFSYELDWIQGYGLSLGTENTCHSDLYLLDIWVREKGMDLARVLTTF